MGSMLSAPGATGSAMVAMRILLRRNEQAAWRSSLDATHRAERESRAPLLPGEGAVK